MSATNTTNALAIPGKATTVGLTLPAGLSYGKLAGGHRPLLTPDDWREWHDIIIAAHRDAQQGTKKAG